MICATLLKPVFIIIVVVGTGLTIVSTFTPGWKHYKDGDVGSGIITTNCGGDNYNKTACENWWKNKEPWQRAVAAFMIIAILIELVVLVWAVISCLACCCPELFYPLPILCALATVCLIIAMSIFGAKNKNDIKDVPDSKNEWDSQSNIGYSFWVGIVALVAMAIASLVGAVVSMASKYAP